MNKKFEDILKFMDSLNDKNLSLSTKQAYVELLNKLNDDYSNAKELIAWRNNSSHVRLMNRMVFIMFFNYIGAFQLAEQVASIDLDRENKFIGMILPYEDVFKLTEVNPADNKQDKKYKTLFRFMLETGIKPQELKNLKMNRKKLYVDDEKGQRQILFNEDTLDSLKKYYPELKITTSSISFRQNLKKYLGPEMTIPALKWYFITYMLNNNFSDVMALNQIGSSLFNHYAKKISYLQTKKLFLEEN